MSGATDSRSSWVLPLEAKNLIKFLTDAEPAPLAIYPDDVRSSTSSVPSEERKDYSESYDFGHESASLNDSTSSGLSSVSAMVLERAHGTGRAQAYDRNGGDSCDMSNGSDADGHSFMFDNSVQYMPVPNRHAKPVGRQAVTDEEQQTQNLLQKVKRLTRGLDDPTDLLPLRHPQNRDTTEVPSDQLDAIQPMSNRQHAPSRFEIADYRTEIVRLRGLLSDEKEKYRNLQVSTGVYEDLKRTPEFELSLLDFVRLQCADICMPLQEETRQLRLLTEQQQHQLDEARHTVSAQTAGMEVQRRLGESSVEAFRMEARAASERCDRLSEKLKMSEDARTLSESLAGRCSIAEGERDQMRQEVSMLRERWEQQGRVLVALNESERALRSEMSDLAKHRDMLDLDKTYLTRELANVNMKYEAESRLVDAQKMHTSTAELKVQELTDRLLQFQLMQRSDLDTRLEVEVRQMKEQAQREMDDLRVTSREIIDRENKVLREAKGALEGQLTAARAELVAVSGKLDSAREQLFLIQSSKDNDIAMLRAEGKLSSYSLSATSANYEERCEQLRLVSLQLEHSREEVNALKTAVQQFEARHGQELLEVTAERDALKHRLAVYEAMETNIDKAVVMVAAGSDHRHSSGSEVHPALRDFLNLPTDPNRRLSQCIAAVGRALEVEKERDQLLIDLSRKSDEFRETQRRLAVADAALARVPHPHGYLVNKLRDLDDVISRQAVQLTACEEKVKALTVTVAETEEGKRLVAHRLEQLLRQRADVEGLRVLLERMQQCEEDDVYASSSESEEDEQPVDMPKAVSSAKRMSTEGKDSFNDSISSMRTRSRAPSEKLNKTWHSPVGSSLKGRADSFVSPTRSHTTSHHKPPAGMSAELFVQMTSPNPERSGGVDTLTSDFGSGHQSHFGSSPGIAVTPNSKSPAWHKRETLLH